MQKQNKRAKKSVVKVVFMSLATCLMAFTLVGGTIAWLTTKTETVVNVFTYGARQYGSYPYDIYGKGVLRFCTFIIPYTLTQYYPLLYLLDRTDNFAYGMLPLVSLWFALPVLALWRFGVRKYKSTGS